MADCLIVIPCHNEAERLDLAALVGFVWGDRRTGLLLVDDGSTDRTLAVLQRLRASCPDQVDLLALPKNFGKAEAVRRGICRGLKSDPKWIGYWDADLATPLDAIAEFRRVLEFNAELQMVFGARVKLLGRLIERRRIRHYLGRVFATAASTVLALPIYDTQCGAKLFRVSAELRDIFDQPFRTNWVFDVEILARLIRARRTLGSSPVERSIYELPLQQWRDVSGSKVKPQDFIKAFFGLLRIYWIYLRPGAGGLPHSPPKPLADPGQASQRAA